MREVSKNNEAVIKPGKNTLRIIAQYISISPQASTAITNDMWKIAEAVRFNTRCCDGVADGPETFVRFLWSDTKLFFHVEVEKASFQCKNTNNKIWDGSNIEFLISPQWLTEPCKDEYEFLFNSNGDSKTLHWTGKGLDDALARETDQLKWQLTDLKFNKRNNSWCFVGEIPFSTFGVSKPNEGDYWGLGMFRKIVSIEGAIILQAWSPTLETPPRFHRPKSFGMLIFKKN